MVDITIVNRGYSGLWTNLKLGGPIMYSKARNSHGELIVFARASGLLRGFAPHCPHLRAGKGDSWEHDSPEYLLGATQHPQIAIPTFCASWTYNYPPAHLWDMKNQRKIPFRKMIYKWQFLHPLGLPVSFFLPIADATWRIIFSASKA